MENTPTATSAKLVLTAGELVSLPGLKLGHMNCRSMLKKQIDIQPLLDPLSICCLGETWLNDMHTDDMVIWPGKLFYRQDRIPTPDKVRGGGLMTYIDTHIFPYSELVENATFQDKDIQCITVKIEQDKHKRLAIVNVYRPPDGSTEGFIDHLKAIFTSIDDGHIEIWILGDLNIDIERDWETGGDSLDTFFVSKGITRLIKSVTYPEGNSCLDHIVTNCPIVLEAGVVADLISDHYPVAAVRKKLKIKYPISSFIGRSYKSYCATQLREDLSYSDWDPFYEEKDPAVQWEVVKGYILEYLDVHCP